MPYVIRPEFISQFKKDISQFKKATTKVSESNKPKLIKIN